MTARRRTVGAALLLLVAGLSVATEPESRPEVVSYGPEGLDLRSPDGNFHAHVDFRGQFRFTHSAGEDEFKVNRVRLKIGGHAYRPWLQYYFEYDFPSSRMLDLRFTLAAKDALQLRVGQWKVPYNRERVDSSGNQQFVDRAIANDPFTLDRQQGVALFGRLAAGTTGDSWYNLGLFSATGRGGSGTVARALLLGRWQWNFLGRDLPFSQSDVEYRGRPAASLALAGASWRGPFTAFSSAGGGQLPGFAPGDTGRYDVRQAMFETAYQYRGFSWQQEYHWKKVKDGEASTETNLAGGYAEAGFFPHTLWPRIPKPLEVAARYALVDPDTDRPDDDRRETSVGFNWFFYGHRNKLSLDVSRLTDDAAAPGRREEHRVRAQWDISF